MKKIALILAMLAAVFSTSYTAAASENIPACSSSRVVAKIVSRFNQTERLYWSHRGLKMVELSRVHHHRGKGYLDSPLHRHRCHATAEFSDGRKRKINFLIEQHAGFAGVGWGVEYCVTGLDPWHYYDGYCRSIKH